MKFKIDSTKILSRSEFIDQFVEMLLSLDGADTASIVEHHFGEGISYLGGGYWTIIQDDKSTLTVTDISPDIYKLMENLPNDQLLSAFSNFAVNPRPI
ncbi:hypothetical protein [Photobacterium kishitanii]|uniref:Uncharacterized protein n=1 Tax=Photobacterium kishitanii TaxID=318456 RepID=A0A2T3KLI1_9GAMM|nr:hypothetical protein [Photobacterium kishitanii]PSV00513.1 hypothetical protein C9J27_05105 [Photobacterium kishitanii]